MEKTFYVYQHKEGNEVVYVGKGQGGRIVATTRQTNSQHQQWMSNRLNRGDLLFAEFIATGLLEQEALLLEQQLIKQLQPRFNKRFTQRQHDKAKAIALAASKASEKSINTPAGVFPSLSAAAKHYNVTVGAIWHRIKNKPQEYFYQD